MNWNRHPILCLYRTGNTPWRKFLDELLVQEGYLCFDSLDLDGVTDLDENLHGRALAFVSAESLAATECERVARYVRQGGRAVLLKPPTELINALGLPIEEQPGQFYAEAPPAYVRLCEHPCTTHHAGVLVQCHAPVSLWHISGASEIARHWPSPATAGAYPAVIETECGQGQVAVFWFDPATAIVRTRQGDPGLASTGDRPDADLDGMYKTSGLFTGQLVAPFHETPQADVLADVLVGVIRGLTDSVLPLSRIWHMPDDAPAMTLLDGDSDGFGWDSYEHIAAACAPAGVPYSVNMLISDFRRREISHSDVDRIFGEGNDLELHYQFETNRPTAEDAQRIIPEQARAFREHTNDRPAVGARGHCVLWPGYTEVAEAMAAAGIVLETSYCPPRGVQYGYGNGSGRASRMMTLDGHSLPVLQQSNTFMDDMLLTTKWLAPPVTFGEIPDLVARFYQESVTRYHGVINTCVHAAASPTDERKEGLTILLEAVLNATRGHDLPALTVRDWVSFLEARRQVDLYYEDANWKVQADTPVRQATIHCPADAGTVRQGFPWKTVTRDLDAGEGYSIS